MAVLKNRAKMSTSTTGTGTITLGSAEDGYQSFADAGVANADVVRYVIEDGNNWEIGTGTYTATGTTLSRTVSESSNSDAAINLSGSATVFIGATAEDIPALDYTLESKTANYTVVSGDLGKIISFSGNSHTVSLTAASSLGSGFHVTIWNLGAFASHTVTIDPNSTETIDGKTTLVLGQGEGVEIVCDGSNWQTNDKKAMRLYAEAATDAGTRPVASGSNAIAIGNVATSSGSNSIAIGLLSDATSTSALALGSYAQAVTGSYATAISRAYASGSDSFAAAIANNTSSYGAQGLGSISIGTLSKATALAGTAVGYAAVSTHVASSAFGTSATTTATNQIALGGSGITARISGAYNLPTSDGTNGQVLTTDGSGAVTFADAGGGGGDPDLYRDNAVNATTPTAAGDNGIAIGSNAVNTTTHGSKNGLAVGTNAVADYWATALGAGTDATGNSSLAVGYNSQATGSKSTAIMNSYASGESSFAAVINNTTSSYGAGGYSNIAMGVNAKAVSNSSTVAIGANTIASGNFAAAVGANCEATNGGSAFGRASDATGGYSLVLGASNLASQFYSVAIGNNAKSEIKGKLAYGSGRFTTNGDVQAGTFILRNASTSATAVVLTSDGSATADTINQIILPNNSAYSFSGTIIARQQAAGGSNYASWEIKGALLRDANAASTVLGNGIVNKLYATSGASAWAIALSADTTNGGLKIEVTGAAATNIRWVATVNTSEVTYA